MCRIAIMVAFASFLTGCGAWPNTSPEAIAANDDSKCASYGLQYGTAEYAQCRQNIDSQRTAILGAYLLRH